MHLRIGITATSWAHSYSLCSSCQITYICRNIGIPCCAVQQCICVISSHPARSSSSKAYRSFYKHIVSLIPVVISFIFLHACYMLLFHRNSTYWHGNLFSILAIASGSCSKALGDAAGRFVTGGGVLIQRCSCAVLLSCSPTVAKSQPYWPWIEPFSIFLLGNWHRETQRSRV